MDDKLSWRDITILGLIFELNKRQIAFVKLWHLIFYYGKYIRSKGKDGLESWNSIKNEIPDIKLSWKENAKRIYKDLRELGTTGDNNDKKDEKWEEQHFLLQHGRIIKNNEGNLMRLMQIAYNSGQFCEANQKNYSEEQKQYYSEHNLNNMFTYLDEEIHTKEIIGFMGSTSTLCKMIIEDYAENNTQINTLILEQCNEIRQDLPLL